MRLKVLISAYSCEPGKGSEPEVGWQWALQMARFHDVTIVTRENNRALIEPELERLKGRQPLPRFVYHDRGPALLHFKRQFKAVTIYYLLWQRSAHEVIQRLNETERFDLLHHVTFAAFRYPVAVWGHNVPVLWGPVGGIESIPPGLLPWHHRESLRHEIARNLHNLLQATPFHILPRRARASTLILASTREMQRVFVKLGFEVQLMPTIGLKTAELPYRPHPPATGPLKVLFVGNIITLKGVDLAIEAYKRSGIDGTFTFVGTGNYEPAARTQVTRLGLDKQVVFRGRLPREQVLKVYSDYDLFLFPSLHDTGGYAVIEAMLNEVPVICLDCGGPAVAVRENCGIKVAVGPREKVIAGLAEALRYYDEHRQTVSEHGRNARAAILQHYDWDRKGEEMNRCYETTMYHAHANQGGAARRYSGMGGLANVLHQMFSVRGLVAAMIGALLIAAAGFMSLSHLKRAADDIVNDTLPGLTYAGEANAHLAQGFNHSLMVLLSDSPDERQQLRKEIEADHRDTTRFLSSYKNQIFTPDDERLYYEMMHRRADYVAVRERMFGLAEANQRSNAMAVCRTELIPAYQRYKETGDRLFAYNMRQGRDRGESIMTICTVTQVVVAFFGVLIFSAGFFLGFFK